MCFEFTDRHTSFTGFDFTPIPHQKKGGSLKVAAKPRSSKRPTFKDYLRCSRK